MRTNLDFKGNTLSRTKVSNHIKKVWCLANKEEKAHIWYQTARDYAVSITTHKVGLSHTSGIISGLSPQKLWENNKQLAKEFIAFDTCGHMKENIRKSRAIKNVTEMYTDAGDNQIWNILNGNKTQRFYWCIKYPLSREYVVVDRHSLSVALGRVATDKEMGMTDNHYKFFEDCYKKVADELNIIPSYLQSVTWEAWIRLKKEKRVVNK